MFVSTSQTPPDGSVLRLQIGGRDWSIPLPYTTITAAAPFGDGLLVAGVMADQEVSFHHLVLQDDRWASVEVGSPPGNHHIARMVWGHSRLALLLGDGAIVSASLAASASLPAAVDFEFVGSAPPGVARNSRAAGLEVTGVDRIEVYVHPSLRHSFVRQPSGEWSRVRTEHPQEPFVRVEQPARIGTDIPCRTNRPGPLILEEEGGAGWWPIAIDVTASGEGFVSSAVSSLLRADRRYRLRSYEIAGPWFFPAAIEGVAWGVSGATVEECRIFESGVRRQYGSMNVGTTLRLSTATGWSSIVKVAFVATTHHTAPPTVARHGHTWLVPDHVLAAPKHLPANRRTHELAVAVPIPDDPLCDGKWIHLQMAVLSQEGTALAATGVRSVRILPNLESRTLGREAEARAAAERYWGTHGVPDPETMWRTITGQ